jgi:hypothetical protein
MCSYLKQAKMSFFFFIQNQRTGGWNRSCLERGVRVGGRESGKMVKEGEYGTNTVYPCM